MILIQEEAKEEVKTLQNEINDSLENSINKVNEKSKNKKINDLDLLKTILKG